MAPSFTVQKAAPFQPARVLPSKRDLGLLPRQPSVARASKTLAIRKTKVDGAARTDAFLANRPAEGKLRRVNGSDGCGPCPTSCDICPPVRQRRCDGSCPVRATSFL